MRTKTLLLSCALLLFTAAASAQPITQSHAMQKASKFFASKGVTMSAKAKAFRAPGMKVASQASATAPYYVFNAGNGHGYAVISGDERAETVLGYSLTGTFSEDSIPENMRAWLAEYGRQIKYMQENNITVSKAADAGSSSDWDVIEPMMVTTWDQYVPYYNSCPTTSSGQRCLTGCVATALAQVLYYQWQQHPNEMVKATAAEIPGYSLSNGAVVDTIPAGTTIDWESLQPTYIGVPLTNQQISAVANLMLYCGAAMKMKYSPSASGASVSPSALTKYFGISEDCANIDRDYYKDDEWNELIYDELASKRVVMYSGFTSDLSGHEFVIHGYAGDNYFNINWGWGGDYDGKFLLSATSESLRGYNYLQGATIGVEPEAAVDGVTAAVIGTDGATMTFSSLKKSELNGRTAFRINKQIKHGSPQWYSYDKKGEITKVVIDESFADVKVRSTSEWFSGFSKLESIEGLKYLNTEKVGHMDAMFSGCSALTSLDVSNFNTQNVTGTSSMFKGCSALISLDVSNFNTQNVTYMYAMFYGCSALKSLDVSNFNTQKVTNMSNMFYDCSSLTSLDVSRFDTQNVTDLYSMFDGCSALTSLDVSKFDTQKVTRMFYMFRGCSALTSLDVSNFNTQNVTRMSSMFDGCSSLKRLDVSRFDTQNVTEMDYMFSECSALTSLDVSKFNTQNVTNMSFMFYKCSALTSLDLRNFDTQKVTRMFSMFNGCSSLKSLDVSNFNTQNVTEMNYMFRKCSALTSLDVSKFNTQKVTDMRYMFYDCSSLTSLDVSKFNTQNVTNMRYMFSYCSSLTSLDVSNFNTQNVTDMAGMFINCSSLTSLDVSNFNTQNVTDMENMFLNCAALTSLDVSKMDISKVATCSYMLYGCKALTELNVGNNNFSNVGKTSSVFNGVGTYSKPCHLTIGEDFDTSVLGTKRNNGTTAYYRWLDGYFTAPTVVTGIDSITESTDETDAPAYNLSGQRVGRNYKGVVIVNGRKTIRR